MSTISVVTPSLDSGAYIGEAIESVLAQAHQPLEHLIVDGGSTDDTESVVSRYGSRVRLLPLPGSTQTEAVNAGVRAARGEIVAILNADDWYLPNGFNAAVAAFGAVPTAAVVYGRAFHAREDGTVAEPYPTAPFDRRELQHRCIICQPAAFIRRDAFLAVGGLNEATEFALDYDLWIRMAERFQFHMFDDYVAVSRMHFSNKTLSRRKQVYREAIRAVKQHYRYVPYAWIIGYARQLVDGGDQYYDVRPPSVLAVLLSFVLGCAINAPDVTTFAREWWAHRAISRLRVG